MGWKDLGQKVENNQTKKRTKGKRANSNKRACSTSAFREAPSEHQHAAAVTAEQSTHCSGPADGDSRTTFLIHIRPSLLGNSPPVLVSRLLCYPIITLTNRSANVWARPAGPARGRIPSQAEPHLSSAFSRTALLARPSHDRFAFTLTHLTHKSNRSTVTNRLRKDRTVTKLRNGFSARFRLSPPAVGCRDLARLPGARTSGQPANLCSRGAQDPRAAPRGRAGPLPFPPRDAFPSRPARSPLLARKRRCAQPRPRSPRAAPAAGTTSSAPGPPTRRPPPSWNRTAGSAAGGPSGDLGRYGALLCLGRGGGPDRRRPERTASAGRLRGVRSDAHVSLLSTVLYGQASGGDSSRPQSGTHNAVPKQDPPPLWRPAANRHAGPQHRRLTAPPSNDGALLPSAAARAPNASRVGGRDFGKHRPTAAGRKGAGRRPARHEREGGGSALSGRGVGRARPIRRREGRGGGGSARWRAGGRARGRAFGCWAARAGGGGAR